MGIIFWPRWVGFGCVIFLWVKAEWGVSTSLPRCDRRQLCGYHTTEKEISRSCERGPPCHIRSRVHFEWCGNIWLRLCSRTWASLWRNNISHRCLWQSTDGLLQQLTWQTCGSFISWVTWRTQSVFTSTLNATLYKMSFLKINGNEIQRQSDIMNEKKVIVGIFINWGHGTVICRQFEISFR